MEWMYVVTQPAAEDACAPRGSYQESLGIEGTLVLTRVDSSFDEFRSHGMRLYIPAGRVACVYYRSNGRSADLTVNGFRPYGVTTPM